MSGGETPHIPVLPEQVLRLLAPRAGDLAMDLTLGAGGHARPLMRAVAPGGALIGMERDGEALGRIAEELKEEGRQVDVRVVLFHGDFRDVGEALDEAAADLAGLACSRDGPGEVGSRQWLPRAEPAAQAHHCAGHRG